jgi:hypothetical protein
MRLMVAIPWGGLNSDVAPEMLRDHAGVDTAEMRVAFDRVFDEAIVFHGYADYMRDYDLFIDVSRSSTDRQCLRYRFAGCVQATAISALERRAWRQLLDDRLLDEDRAGQADGFQWWVKWQCLYPGMTLVPDSAEAERWSHDTGVTMFEAVIETNVHRISLVFHDLVVESVADGSVPFRVPGAGATG